MKIRTGFVSNSSSASFIVNIQVPIEKFFCQFNDERLRSWIEYYLYEQLKLYENLDEKSLTPNVLEYQLEFKAKLEKTLNQFESGVITEETILDLLDIYQIELNSTDTQVTLTNKVVMFNWYSDSMSDLLNELILFQVYDKIPVSFNVIED